MSPSADNRERRRQRLIEVGEAVYGERWQRAMARGLNVPQSYISQIVAGDRPVSDNVNEALAGWVMFETITTRSLLEQLVSLSREFKAELGEVTLNRLSEKNDD